MCCMITRQISMASGTVVYHNYSEYIQWTISVWFLGYRGPWACIRFLHVMWCDVVWHSGCRVTWTRVENQGSMGGRLRRNATTVEACKEECLSTAHCNGFDFTSRNRRKCWLAGPWSHKQKAMTDVTRYNLARQCNGTYHSFYFRQHGP